MKCISQFTMQYFYLIQYYLGGPILLSEIGQHIFHDQRARHHGNYGALVIPNIRPFHVKMRICHPCPREPENMPPTGNIMLPSGCVMLPSGLRPSGSIMQPSGSIMRPLYTSIHRSLVNLGLVNVL